MRQKKKFYDILSHRRTQEGIRCNAAPWLCSKVLKPHFQSVIFQTTYGCSLLSLILRKLLLLDIGCKNIFALAIVSALTVCPISTKKYAKMSVFYVETAKIRWRLGATPPDPLSLRRSELCPQTPGCTPPLLNPRCTTALFPQSS